MSSHYEQQILDHVRKNPGIPRRALVKAFPHITQKTAYKHIQNLLLSKHIKIDGNSCLYPNEHKELVWPIHSLLKDFKNPTTITQAFAQKDTHFFRELQDVVNRYPAELTKLLVDLTVILAISRGQIELADHLEQADPVSKESIDLAITSLENALKQY